MCDVESYCYLPLLEETKYMPKHKYSYGFEIREYLDSIAAKYELPKNAMFRTKIDSLTWNETSKQWDVAMTKERNRRSCSTSQNERRVCRRHFRSAVTSEVTCHHGNRKL